MTGLGFRVDEMSMKFFASVCPILVEADQHVKWSHIFSCRINRIPSEFGIVFPSTIRCAYEMGKGTRHATVFAS